MRSTLGTPLGASGSGRVALVQAPAPTRRARDRRGRPPRCAGRHRPSGMSMEHQSAMLWTARSATAAQRAVVVQRGVERLADLRQEPRLRQHAVVARLCADARRDLAHERPDADRAAVLAGSAGRGSRRSSAPRRARRPSRRRGAAPDGRSPVSSTPRRRRSTSAPPVAEDVARRAPEVRVGLARRSSRPAPG